MSSVTITAPARKAFVNLIRTTVCSACRRLDLTIDDLDDISLAVDEACACLLSQPSEPTRLRVEVRPFDGGVEVTVSVDTAIDWPPPQIQTTLSWHIMTALMDSVTSVITDAGPSFLMKKETRVTLGDRVT